eukprot:scaffold1590_cov140-Cylindrotheca_fusiformis.AAC.1
MASVLAACHRFVTLPHPSNMVFGFDWWEYALIPIIAGFVGYETNVVALHLTFYPLEFLGIELFRLDNQPWGLFGWQGIIPTKAKKMASTTFDLMTTRLLSIHEIFSRLEPETFGEAMDDVILLMMDKVINEVANKFMPKAWNSIPKEVRDDIIVSADGEHNKFLVEFMNDMQARIEDVVDIKEIAVSACIENKHLIVKIFQECGEREFVFIRRSGFYFGFLFGLIQMIVWFFYPADWILPVAGFAVGWVTNWMALKVIFEPVAPVSVCGYKLQGIFLMTQDDTQDEAQFQHLLDTKGVGSLEGWVARFTPFFKESIQKAKLLPSAVKLTPSIRSIFQPIRPRPLNIRGRPPDSPPATRRRRRPRLNPVSSILKASSCDRGSTLGFLEGLECGNVFARVVCTEILHIKAIWESVFTGKLSKNFAAPLRAHTLAFTSKLLAEVEPLAIAALGMDKFLYMKESIAQKVIQKLPEVIDSSYEYTQSALGMEETISEEMRELPFRDFEGVLHPAFEEDEIQLVLLGGVLGAIDKSTAYDVAVQCCKSSQKRVSWLLQTSLSAIRISTR